jgi:hypothetical protein
MACFAWLVLQKLDTEQLNDNPGDNIIQTESTTASALNILQ